MSKEYWSVMVDDVIPDMGIVLTAEQRSDLLEALSSHASMEREASGESVWDSNLSASRQREIDDAKKQVRFEQEKLTCGSCNGKGSITTYGGTLQ